VRWSKPAARPEWMSLDQYRGFPNQSLVREARVDGKVLVTTMPNARAVSKRELAAIPESDHCLAERDTL
jgi:hypothetical protein